MLSQVDGLMARVSVGGGQVWGVSEDGALWWRAGLGPGTPMGSHWTRLQVSRGWSLVTKHRMLRDDYVQDGHDLGWRMVLILDTALWAVDTRDCLMLRENVTPDNIQGQIFHDYDCLFSSFS